MSSNLIYKGLEIVWDEWCTPPELMLVAPCVYEAWQEARLYAPRMRAFRDLSRRGDRVVAGYAWRRLRELREMYAPKAALI